MRFLKRIFVAGMFLVLIGAPECAHAQWGMIDKLNISPFVPLVLDTMMTVATGLYEFFVGDAHHTGIIYTLVWGFLLFTLSLNLAKMYLPKPWIEFIGFSAGQTPSSGMGVIQDLVMKPVMRALIATTILLQLKPVYLTEWLINPFLELGAIYTHAITDTVNNTGIATPRVQCPANIMATEWISESSCEFLVQPVSDLSQANNTVIKRGFELIDSGLRGLITLVPHGGAEFMNLITGLLLVITFFSSNLFMALLIIQGIFNFGMALALYPFSVLSYVVKPSKKWLDIWPAFASIATALQKLIITMIACAFILCVNLAVIQALFGWNASVFIAAAGGTAGGNVPSASVGMGGFGNHSVIWVSTILTFYLMFRIFKMTREQLDAYVGPKMDDLYKKVNSDTKTMWQRTKDSLTNLGKAVGWFKKK